MTTRDYVTVVSGVPRSGTSAMMQALAAGGLSAWTDRLREADASNPRGYFELEAVKDTPFDASWVGDAVGQAVKVIHLLLPHLPETFDYRVVMMRRDLRDVLASQARMLERLGRPGGGADEATLIAQFSRQLEAAIDCAIACPNFALIEVDYAALTTSPVDELARVAEFLDGGLDVQAMAASIDPSLRHW